MTAGGESRLRVLVYAPHEAWPLNCGGRLHLYNVLTQLDRRANVTLALPFPPEHPERLPKTVRIETIPDAGVRDRCDAVRAVQIPPIGRRVQRHYGVRPAVAGWLHRETDPDRFDVVMLNGAVAGQYWPYCQRPVVWNPQDELVLPTLRDAEFAGWRHWGQALRRATLYALFERWVATHVGATIYVSSIDAAYARVWARRARLEVVQNGVDFEYFRPVEEPPEPETVVFIGSLWFPPNVDGIVHFVRSAWPQIRAGGAQRRLLVVGRQPAEVVRQLGRVAGVEIHPDVPDVRPYLARAAVVIVPTRKGGGLKNKILEACAAGRPMVAHPRALGGLNARPGVDVIAADRPGEWVRQIERLLTHPEHAQTMARNGLAWVRRAHSWAQTGARFYEVLRSVACGRGAIEAPANGSGAARAARERMSVAR